MSKVLSFSNIKKPMRIVNHIGLKMSYKLRLDTVPFLPTRIDIEPNNWCNFKCDHCQVTHWSKPRDQLTEKSFKQIIEQFPNLLLVKVQGMGEPFLNKSIIEMLELLDKKRIPATMTSNGSVLTDAMSSRLSKLKDLSISFSMDGGTKSVFEKIRIKGNFDKVTSNIQKFTEKCSNLNINFWVVLTKENVTECENVVMVANRTGVPEVTFQTFLTNWGKSEMETKINDKLLSKKESESNISKAKKLGEGLNIQVNSFAGNYLEEGELCQWPWESVYIDAKGDVVPCCVIADSEVLNFGNIFKRNISEIWNSKRYINFRKEMKEGNIPDVCKGCYRSR